MSFSFPGKDGEMLRMAEKTQPLWGGKERNRKSELGLLLEARKRLGNKRGSEASKITVRSKCPSNRQSCGVASEKVGKKKHRVEEEQGNTFGAS